MTNDNLLIGSKIVIPEPQDDDSWNNSIITEVEDINDDGTIMFMDDEYVPHEIETSRIQLYKG